MPRKKITDAALKNLKKAPPGKRYEIMDLVTPGFGVRVNDKGQGTFILKTRYPHTPINPTTGYPNPTRRTLGEYGPMTLEEARAKAEEWLRLIRQGIDPREEEEAEREEADRKRDTTFGTVIEDYLKRHVAGKRKARDVEREVRTELIPVWKDKPVTEITRGDVVSLIEEIADRPARYHAHNVFGHVRTFFNWAIDRGKYGLETSPCDRLKPARLIGAKKPRQRVLSDDELFAFMRAADRLGYPFGPMFKLLAITGQRKSEVSDARWREFDLERAVWTVPPERFKSDASHLVPLTDDALDVLRSLPRFRRGDHLFSTTFGEKPVSGFSKAKARLDKRMLRTLKALARKRGEDPKAVTLEPFVIHDIRRTMRTGLSSLRVPDVIAETVIGHGRKGLQRVYDQHQYADEMREALGLWAGRLREIATPPPDNVVQLEKMGA